MVLFNRWLGVKGIHEFPKSISLKTNLIEWLEIELAYNDVALHLAITSQMAFNLYKLNNTSQENNNMLHKLEMHIYEQIGFPLSS